MTHPVPSFIQTGINCIPVYGPVRTGIVVGSFLLETFLKYVDTSTPNIVQRKGLDIQVRSLRVIQILALLGATRIFSSKFVSIPVSVMMAALMIPKIELLIDLYTGAKKFGDQGVVNTQMPSSGPIINKSLLYAGLCTKVVNIFAVGLFASTLFSQKHVSTVAAGVSSMAIAQLTLYNGFKDFDPNG